MKIVVESFGTDADKDEYFKIVGRTVANALRRSWPEQPVGVELSFRCLKQTPGVNIGLITVFHTMAEDKAKERFFYAIVNAVTNMKERECELKVCNFP